MPRHMDVSEHAAVSAEAASFRVRLQEAARASTGPGVDHGSVYASGPAPAPPPESPHKLRAAGVDRFSLNGGVEALPRQKKHYETASSLRSDHVDASFKVRLSDCAMPAAAACCARLRAPLLLCCYAVRERVLRLTQLLLL